MSLPWARMDTWPVVRAGASACQPPLLRAAPANACWCAGQAQLSSREIITIMWDKDKAQAIKFCRSSLSRAGEHDWHGFLSDSQQDLVWWHAASANLGRAWTRRVAAPRLTSSSCACEQVISSQQTRRKRGNLQPKSKVGSGRGKGSGGEGGREEIQAKGQGWIDLVWRGRRGAKQPPSRGIVGSGRCCREECGKH